jgi:polysaccharide export outer membrane protein
MRRKPSLCLLLLLLALAPAAPLTAQVAGASARDSVSPAEAGARIRPGDQVTLRIFREPDLSGAFTISDAGELVLPRLGRLAVTRYTPHELQESLLCAYGDFLRNPAVEVTVLRRIGVQGEVRRPDTYMVDLTVTLRDLIARAGGVTESGNPNRITIVRGAERIEVDKTDQGRFSTAELYSGDQVVVGRRSWMALNPAVAVSTATSLISFIVGIVLLTK